MYWLIAIPDTKSILHHHHKMQFLTCPRYFYVYADVDLYLYQRVYGEIQEKAVPVWYV